MARTFTAQYPSICARCNERIETGAPITWARRGTKGVFHAACMSADITAAVTMPTFIAATAERTPAAMPTDFALTAPAATADMFPSTPTAALAPEAMMAAIMAAMQSVMGAKAPAAATASAPKAKPAPAPNPEKTAVTSISNRSKWWDVLEACIESGLTRILLVGPPGTGKSTTADRDGQRVTCYEDAGPESITGTFIQKDGNTVWIDGPAVRAMRTGTRIVLDETDHSSPECVSLLYALLDDAPSIMLPTGECVKATKGYQVIGTSNSSPSDFPEAIIDRFEAIIVAAEPHPAAISAVKDEAGTKSEALTGLMQNYYRGLSSSTYNFRGNPTLRKCRNYARLLKAGLHSEVAAKVVFGLAGKEIASAMTTSDTKVGW